MDNRGRGRVFQDSSKLNEMLKLHSSGTGLSELGRKYGVDHSTIFYHVKKHALMTVSGMDGVGQPRVIIQGSTAVVRIAYDGSPINQGKDYADYIREQREKRWNELLSGGRNK